MKCDHCEKEATYIILSKTYGDSGFCPEHEPKYCDIIRKNLNYSTEDIQKFNDELTKILERNGESREQAHV